MQVTVTIESRLSRTPDGAVWSTGWLEAAFWDRYLDVFNGVRVVARVAHVTTQPPYARRVDRPGISFLELPCYVGLLGFIRHYAALRQRVIGSVGPDDAVILRVPGAIATLVERRGLSPIHPFAVEVVGDPDQVFRPGGVRSVFNPLYRRRFAADLRRQCARACAVAYVSERFLQERYPAQQGTFQTHFSSIDLQPVVFRGEPRTYEKAPSPLRIVSVGSLEQLYKGPDVLIDAVSLLHEPSSPERVEVNLTWVGDGRYREALQQRAAKRSFAHAVHFAGQLDAGGVRNALDNADLFVLPSSAEGLPRAMIEAMARGLPCIGTTVGAIPELLELSELVPPNAPDALARKIRELAQDPRRLSHLSRGNLHKAAAYRADQVRPRRRAFYEFVRGRSEHRTNTR